MLITLASLGSLCLSSFWDIRHGPDELISFGGRGYCNEEKTMQYDTKFYLGELKYKLMTILLSFYYHEHMSANWCLKVLGRAHCF